MQATAASALGSNRIALSPTRVGLLRGLALVLAKDMLIEWRTRARLNALVIFAFGTLLIFSFALGPDTQLLQRNAGGYLWLALLFASLMALGESFRIERENSALEGLRLLPVDPRAFFLGKALGNAAVLIGLAFVLVPVMVGLFGVSISLGFGPLALTLILGCLAISAPGTLYSAVASNARARDVLLPLLLFPLIIPALLAAVKATSVVLQGDPMSQLRSWFGLLVGFNLVYWGLGVALFPQVVEE